jgi:hypothetical protein
VGSGKWAVGREDQRQKSDRTIDAEKKNDTNRREQFLKK